MLVACVVLTVLAFAIPGVGGTAPRLASTDDAVQSAEGEVPAVEGEVPDQAAEADGPAAPDAVDGAQAEADAADGPEEGGASGGLDVDSAWLPADMEPELAQALREAARTDAAAAFALSRAAEYARFGAEYQTQLLELAAQEPGARAFVVRALKGYPATSVQGLSAADRPQLDVRSADGVAAVPRLWQWDVRWGCLDYSSGPLGVTGCCPTSLSMVYVALTGNLDGSPADLARLAQERGYVSEADGTYAEFLPAIAPELGLRCEELAPTADNIRAGLAEGAVLVCDVGPGEFTDGGHFFVITAQNADGTVSINDPYSQARSAMAWDPERLAGQAIGLYAFWRAS